MSKFEFMQKIPGIRNTNVRLAVGAFVILVVGIVIYILQLDPLQGGKAEADKKNLKVGETNLALIDDIADTKGNPKVESTIESSVFESPVIINGHREIIREVQPPELTEQQKAIQQLRDQARMKELQAGLAAISAKTATTPATAKGGASDTIGASPQMQASNSPNESANGVNNSDSPYLGSDLLQPKSPYELQAGSIIPAVMISGLNSEISGQVSAQVRENVYDSISGRYLLVPQGSKLVGQFNNSVAYGQNRIAVAWQRLIYPNGYSISLKGIPGSSVDGFQGFYDQVDNHYWQLFGSSFIMGVITAGMQYSQNNTSTTSQIGGFYNPTVGQTMAGSLGQQLGQTGMMITQKQLNIAPTITVHQGYKFSIMMTADLVLKPYKQGQ